MHRLLAAGETHPWTAVTLTTLSGMSAAVGGLIVVCAGAPSPRVLGHLLSFAAGIMLYISYGDLLPHAIADLSAGGEAAPGHEGHGHGSTGGFFLANCAMLGGMVRAGEGVGTLHPSP